jgi:AraC family transcriptional regulator of adaptative response / DNA-3-methyladenine glycosylase II
VELKLGYRAPYDWASLCGFLATRAIPGLETCAGGYERTVRLGDVKGILAVSADQQGALTARLTLDGTAPLLAVVAKIRTLFDLDADTAGIEAHLATDRRLAPLVARAPGLRIPGAWDVFELAVRAVIGQQVTVAGARTLLAGWSPPMARHWAPMAAARPGGCSRRQSNWPRPT